jgi:hypothetical protein
VHFTDKSLPVVGVDFGGLKDLCFLVYGDSCGEVTPPPAPFCVATIVPALVK